MKQNEKKSVEEEFHASQLYKTLRGAGIPAGDSIVKGLDKAVQTIDGAITGFVQGVQQGGAAGQNQRPGQNQSPDFSTGRGAPQNSPGRTGNYGNRRASGYTYQHTYPQQTSSASGQRPNPQTAYAPGASQPAGRRPSGVNPVPAPQMPPMKMVRRGSPMKFYITGIAALLYAWNMPLYEPGHFAALAIVLVVVFLLSGALFKGKKEFVPVEEEKKAERKEPEKKEEPKEKKSSTGNPEVDKIIDEGSEYLKKLRAANDAIPDEALSACIERMERASADIFRYIGDHPEKAPQIRKFMNYYLPTTLKLLNSYQRLSSQSVKGENITSTMFNIAGMMHTVADAFEKQLDSLFSDEAMDISADITVFESMLKQEGFAEEMKK